MPSPETVAAPDLTALFTKERPRLVGLAYRITGSRLDAEDIVQEAWLRAQRVDWSALNCPEAWLTTVVSRLALDDLRSAWRRRETYVGPWLPEPVRTGDRSGGATVLAHAVDDPAEHAELAESLTFAFLRLLDTLSPTERVVFLLADVFDTPYREIAPVVDRSPETCRRIASRARRRVRAGQVRHDPPDDAAKVARSLLVAIGLGDVDAVLSLLADDVVLVSDGGADARAARRPVRGADRVARLVLNLARRQRVAVEEAVINREPGVVVRRDGALFLAITGQVVNGKVQEIYVVVNPDKLAALEVITPMT